MSLLNRSSRGQSSSKPSRSHSRSSSSSPPPQQSQSKHRHSREEYRDHPRSQRLSPLSHSEKKADSSRPAQLQQRQSSSHISQSRHRSRSRSRSNDRESEPRHRREVRQEFNRPDRPITTARDAPPNRPFRRGPPSRRPPTEDPGNLDWGKTNSSDGSSEPPPQQPKEKPTLELSGNLLKDTNTFNGVLIKYSEPEEAKMPKRRWRLYEFKSDAKSSESGGLLRTLHMHRQSAYLIGTDQRVCDMHVLHPSISKQHAAWQYRCVNYTRPDGFEGRRVLPYIMDLESTNGTFLNNDRIEPRRYYELQPRDVLKFGFSSREYVVLYEGFRDTEPDADDQGVEGPKPRPTVPEQKSEAIKSEAH